MSRSWVLLSALAASTAIVDAQAPIRAIGRLVATDLGYELQELSGRGVAVTRPGIDPEDWVGGLVGGVVDLTGTPEFGPQGATFVVRSVAPSLSTFHTSGDTRIGEYLHVRIDTVGTSRWYLYFSPGFDIVPLEHLLPIASGTLWLDPGSLFSVSAGGFAWRWQDRLLVPNDPSLIGAVFWLQGAIHTVPGPLLFLNADKVTILP
jgi:hypothetical protein